MASNSQAARPFIKWAGGKQGLAADLVTYFPQRFHRYYEPFLGGGSVFFRLSAKHAVLSDSNSWLMQTYQAIRDDCDAVAVKLDQLPNTREAFLKARQTDPISLSRIESAALFIYLNKTCFRGLYRVNRLGRFNVPYGDYQRRYYDLQELRAAADTLKTATLTSTDFELALAEISPSDFAYLDPPYFKQGGYADFNRYTPSQFRDSDHIRLAAFCRELDTRRIRWAVSNSDTPFVRQLFAGFKFHQIHARREINLQSDRRAITELLITNYQACPNVS